MLCKEMSQNSGYLATINLFQYMTIKPILDVNPTDPPCSEDQTDAAVGLPSLWGQRLKGDTVPGGQEVPGQGRFLAGSHRLLLRRRRLDRVPPITQLQHQVDLIVADLKFHGAFGQLRFLNQGHGALDAL